MKLKLIVPAIFLVATLFSLVFVSGYNFRYLTFVFGCSRFSIDGYEFHLTRKFSVLQIYDRKTGILYQNGFIPFHKNQKSCSYVMLRHAESNDVIYIKLDSSNNGNIKNTCLKLVGCKYKKFMIFGKQADGMVFSRLPKTKFTEIPDLKINISSNLIDGDALSEIDISKNP